MPLLKKKTFEKYTPSELLRDDESVFYCEITGEIFRNYEEFSERMFLCNSMVWTCSLTGKSNLTYSEALDSEKQARKNLMDFPQELKLPILYLCSRTKRSSFRDLTYDIFNYAKDRFFIGENIEFSVNNGIKWKSGKITNVLPPKTEEINNSSPKNGILNPKASLYKYEVKEDKKNEKTILESSQIRRKRFQFSRDKMKLFLKQNVEQNDLGMFQIKPKSIRDYNLNNVKFENIFNGPQPFFDTSKRVEKINSNNNNNNNNIKKTKQETITKFLTGNSDTKDKPKNQNNLLEQMRRREEEFKLRKQQREEEKLIQKQKKKEDDMKLANYLKDWFKPKEDLELEDQKILPIPTELKLQIPEKYIGDLFMIIEFVYTFSKLLSLKDFFPSSNGGLTIDLLERALLNQNEIAGPLIDIIQMFLLAIFNLQDEEAKLYRTQIDNSLDKKDEISNNLTLHEATRLATLASVYSVKYQGLPLARLPLYTLTTPEILRLHLLSSGARINETGAKWRFAQRGYYSSEDDPGLYLCLHKPHLIKLLSKFHLVQLAIDEKLEILQCLMNQILTYANVRQIVDENMEDTRQSRINLKLLLANEKKRQQEFLGHCLKLRKEEKNEENLQQQLEILQMENNKKRIENEKKIQELIKTSKQIQLGQDRAFRKYLKLESIPGLFVCWDEENPGQCLNKQTEQNPKLVNADLKEIKEYLRKLFDGDSSEEIVTNTGKLSAKDLLLCTADSDCLIHSTNRKTQLWSFFSSPDQIDQLINSLNVRGIREGDLLQIIKTDRDYLLNLIERTPTNLLNPTLKLDDEKNGKLRKSQRKVYDDPNLGFPRDMDANEVLHNLIIENLLDLEERIFAGNLGRLNVDRIKWRNCLTNKNYKEIDKSIIKKETDRNDDNSRPTTPISEHLDPATTLTYFVSNQSTIAEIPCQNPEITEAIRTLSICLTQIAIGIEPKYLKKPLGHCDNKYNDKKKEYDVLDKWQQSLLAASSFSQIFLHYGTLDSCVMWSRSVLQAKCRICKKQRDSENMLLCDSCNLGYHLYCLKPTLTCVPEGDWFCVKCEKERKKDETPPPVVQPPLPRKVRVFRDNSDGDMSENESDKMENGSENDYNSNESDNDNDNSALEMDESDRESGICGSTMDEELCKMCNSSGDLLHCIKCNDYFHYDCLEPPLKRPPRGQWICNCCKERKVKKRKNSDEDWHENNNQRQCALKAKYKIHNFAKSLRILSESSDENDDDDDDEQTDNSEESEAEEVINRRSHRTDGNRRDLPLHNAALQELLTDIMHNNDAWPFLRPVQKNEVPDYYDVITKPMDFGTIKYKLNMGEYKQDSELMADALLVFQNSNMYNHSEDDVYKCGVKLLKHFQRKSRELGLVLPAGLEYDSDNDDSEQPRKKIRTK